LLNNSPELFFGISVKSDYKLLYLTIRPLLKITFKHMKNLGNKNQLRTSVNRYKIETEKNNTIFVEEVNQSEMETIWKTLSEIQMIF